MAQAAGPSVATPLFTLDWYRTLSPSGRRAFLAAWGGYTLAAFDILSFTFVLAPLRASFGLTDGQVGALATVSLVASVVGGTVGGVLADRFGRARLLRWSIVAYALCSLLSGFAQTYEQLLVARALLGIGFGAEWTAGALLVAEYAASAQRGRALGVYATAYSVGDGLATLGFVVLSAALPADMTWRALFWLGVLPALLVLWTRRRVVDAPVFRAAEQPSTRAGGSAPPRPALSILWPPLLVVTVAGSALASGLVGGKYILNIWLPEYLHEVRELAGAAATPQIAAVLVGAALGSVLGGYCQDGLGRRRTFLLYALASVGAYWAYLLVPDDAAFPLLPLGLALGFATAGAMGGLGAYLAELYPSTSRGAGQGLTYNVGRAASGLLMGGIGWLAALVDLSSAMALGTGVYLVALVALRFLPETRGRSLGDAAPVSSAPVPVAVSAKPAPRAPASSGTNDDPGARPQG